MGLSAFMPTDGPKLVSDHRAFKDGAIGVEVKFENRKGTNAGLIVRVDKPGIGADRFIGYEISLDPGRQRLLLARHRNNFEPIKEVPCELAVGRWVPLEVRLSGSVIEIFVNGKSLLLHDDGVRALPAGTFGLRAWHCEASYRKLWVKTGSEPQPLAFKQAEDITEVSGMWRPLRAGTAQGRFALISEHPFAGTQSQQVAFTHGQGEWGVENQGLNRWGMHLVAGEPTRAMFGLAPTSR